MERPRRAYYARSPLGRGLPRHHWNAIAPTLQHAQMNKTLVQWVEVISPTTANTTPEHNPYSSSHKLGRFTRSSCQSLRYVRHVDMRRS